MLYCLTQFELLSKPIDLHLDHLMNHYCFYFHLHLAFHFGYPHQHLDLHLRSQRLSNQISKAMLPSSTEASSSLFSSFLSSCSSCSSLFSLLEDLLFWSTSLWSSWSSFSEPLLLWFSISSFWAGLWLLSGSSWLTESEDELSLLLSSPLSSCFEESSSSSAASRSSADLSCSDWELFSSLPSFCSTCCGSFLSGDAASGS